MGTKNNPGKFDCYQNALPDEPMFVLLARDPEFCNLVSQWANKRMADIRCGLRPDSDLAVCYEALDCAVNAENWRKNNNGIWRK